MSVFREISFVGYDIAPLVLFPAAIGAAVAGIAGRRMIAIVLLVVAIAALVLPILLGVIALLNDPGLD